MAINLKVLTSINTTNSAVSWSQQAQQTTILYSANKNFMRNVVLSSDGISVRRGTNVVGINIATLVVACALVDSALTYAPVIVTNPASHSVAAPTATTFGAVSATSELAVTYQWQLSTNGGSTWSNVTNAGVYSGATTATLSISNSTGLNANQYRCTITNTVGSTNTAAGILTVT